MFEKVIWVDNHFNEFTTIIVVGLFYTFTGSEVDNNIIYTILERLEFHEEDQAELEMSPNVSKIFLKEELSTGILIN